MRADKAPRGRLPGWAWVVGLLVLVIAAPSATFLANRGSAPRPAKPQRQGDAVFFGRPAAFRSSFEMSFGPGSLSIATAPVTDVSGSAQSRPLPTLEVVTSDRTGRYWVVDHPLETRPRARVRLLDPRGRVLRTFTTPSGATLFTPGLRDDLWLDLPAGASRGERVQRYSSRGRLLGEYQLPKGYFARFLRIDQDGDVYAYQEQWAIDSKTGRNTYGGTLLPVATGKDSVAVSGVKPFDGMFFGADDRLYVAEASQGMSTDKVASFLLKAIDRSGKQVASYRFPAGYMPVGADPKGLVYAELAPSLSSDNRGEAGLGDVQFENADIMALGPGGERSTFRVKRPGWVGGWPRSIWVDPAGRVGALAFGKSSVSIGTISLGDMPVPEKAGDAGKAGLRIITSAEPETADPYAARDDAERDLMRLVYSGLVRLDASLEPQPGLATSVPVPGRGVSSDGKTITYQLRGDVRWQDGEPFSAKDVEATWLYLKMPRPDARTEPFPGFSHIVSVKASGATQVTVRLDQPFGAGPEAFFPYVLPEHLLQRYGTASNSPLWAAPIGTGPFRLVIWERGDSWRLVRSGGGGLPGMDVLFRAGDQALAAFQSSPVPAVWTGLDAAQADAVTRDKVGTFRQVETGKWQGILLDSSSSALRDAATRRALLLAYPRAALARDILPSKTATDAVDLFPRVSAAHDPNGVPAASDDTRTAGEMLKRAGWRKGAEGLLVRDGVRLELPLSVGRRAKTDEASFEYVTSVSNAWSSIDTLAYRSMSTPGFYSPWVDGGFLSSATYAAAYGIFQGTPDPGWGGVLDAAEQPGPKDYRGIGVASGDSRIAGLYARARASYDPKERDEIGREISRLVRDEAYAILVRHDDRGVAVLGNVKNFEPSAYPAGDFWNAGSWKVAK